MSGSHAKLPKLFWVQIALVAIVLAFYLLAPSPLNHGEDATEAAKLALAPVGKVATSESGAVAGAGAERTGEEIVNKTCLVCHAAGVANAPKLDETGKASWQQRYDRGMDSMIQTAKTGKGGMPPMGGDPTLSDNEIRNAIVYMLGKAGIDASAEADAGSVTASAEKSVASPVATTAEASEIVTNAVAITAPAVVSTPTAPVEAAPPQAPAAPEAPSMTEQTPPAPDAPAEASTPAVPEASSMQAVSSAGKSAPAAVASVSSTSVDGEKVYKASCFACHDMAVAGAPKIGDKAVWEPRIAAGKDVLYHSALNGKQGASGVMPPKGGNVQLTDDEVRAAVDYMVSRAE